MGYRGNDRFATDPTGMLAAGAPGGGAMGPGIGGSGFSVGRVGMPISSAAVPGQSMGTGLGGGVNIPLGRKHDASDVRAKKKGGAIKKMAKGGSTASKRGDGCATKGKTKGRFV